MPAKKSKRKAVEVEDTMFGGNKSKKVSLEDEGGDETKILDLFNSFADDDDPETISMEGISKLGEQLDMDPASDVRLLVLLWKLGAVSKPGLITKTEFITGMKKIRKDSIKGLKSISPSFDLGFLERQQFRELYRFVFKFNLEGTHKTLEKDMVIALLGLVLDTNRAPHLNHFIEFLQQCSAQRITLDQWDSFLQFQHNVKLDLSDYDADNGAWPLLLDEYVEWKKNNK